MLNVHVCVGTSCSYKGGLDILEYLEHDESLREKISLLSSNCINKACKPDNSPVVMVDDEILTKTTLDKVLSKIREKM